jgi:hypothetical protein
LNPLTTIKLGIWDCTRKHNNPKPCKALFIKHTTYSRNAHRY